MCLSQREDSLFAPLFSVQKAYADRWELGVRTLFALFFLSSFLSCSGLRHLPEGTTLLRKNKIDLLHNDKDEKKSITASSLKALMPHRPNKRFFYIPIAPSVYLYHFGEARFDENALRQKMDQLEQQTYEEAVQDNPNEKKKKKWIERRNRKISRLERKLERGNAWMRLGEPIAIYTPEQAKETQELLHGHLFSEGFFNAQVLSEVRHKGRRSKVTYVVRPGLSFKIDSIFYDAENETSRQILLQNRAASHLRQGERYRYENVLEEKERIYGLFQNRGYFLFRRNYVRFLLDTTRTNLHKVLVGVQIRAADSLAYRVYAQDSVHYFLGTEDKTKAGLTPEVHSGKVFHFDKYNRGLLAKMDPVVVGEPYHRDQSLSARGHLNRLDVIRFVDFQEDTTTHKVNTRIRLHMQKRYRFVPEVGLAVSQGLPSPFVETKLQGRNVFKQWENMEIGLRLSLAGITTPSSVVNPYRTVEGLYSMLFSYPDLLFPSFLWPKRWRTQNPRTRFLLTWRTSNRLEYFRVNVRSAWSYVWEQGPHTQYSVSPLGVTLTGSRLTPVFEEILRSYGNNLLSSFQTSLVNVFAIQYRYANHYFGYAPPFGYYFNVSISLGGLFAGLYRNALQESVFRDFLRRETGQGLTVFSFSKIFSEYRQYTYVLEKGYVVWRVKTGIVVPHVREDGLPYEEFFFSGGSNSVRAWLPRRLGPGGYQSPSEVRNLEQPAEIQWEANIEYRHLLASSFHGALFLDQGNVWHLYPSPATPLSEFSFPRALGEIAWGTGAGLRYDWGTLLLRLDAAAKVYEPARAPQERWVLDELINNQPWNSVVFGISVGYPF